jgi:hypothetical protein
LSVTLRRAFAALPRALRLVASALAVSSYFAYTTAGFDFEVDNGKGVDARYYRLRWDDGSTWVGMAVQPCLRPARPLDWFDPGGTLLALPTRPAHRSWWNDLGFWRVAGPAGDPFVATRYVGATASEWWACPSWLVVLALWGRPIWRLARRRAGGSSRPTDTTATTPPARAVLDTKSHH